MTTHATTTDDGIPEALRRTTNDRGVTLSAGVEAPVAATGKKGKKYTGKRKSRGTPSMVDADEMGVEPTDAALEPADVANTMAAPQPAVVGVEQPVVSAETGEPLVKVRRSIVPMRFKDRYAKHGGTCGDDMALELKAATTKLNEDKRETLDLDALKAIAEANGINTAKYAGLNNGQWRMNVGNKLRGKLAAGEDVVVGSRTFKAEDFAPRG